MLKVEVVDANVLQKTSKKGQPYYKQVGWAYFVDRDGVQEAHPTKIQLFVSKDAAGNPQPFKPGIYTLHPSSFRADQWGQLEIGFTNLVPMVTEARKAG